MTLSYKDFVIKMIESSKSLNNEVFRHKIQLIYSYNASKPRGFKAANLCDDWGRCETLIQLIGESSVSFSNCSTTNCNYTEVFEIDLYELINNNNTDLDIYLRKDDVLHVSESDTDQAYAFGEFTTSGPISVYKDLTLTELLATKGINKATAKTKNIYVLREDLTKFLHVDIYTINLNNPAAFIAV